MLRQLAKTGVAWALSGTRSDRLVGALRGSPRAPLVVGYHRVVEDFEASKRGALPGMIVSRRMLEQHLDWIGRRFRFASLGELGASLESHESPSTPLAAVTFDDGYADVYEQALPLLRRKGIPAAVFVVTDNVTSGALQVYDRLHISLSRALVRGANAPRQLARLLLDLALPLPSHLLKRGLPRDPFAALRALLDALPQAGLLRVAAALDSQEPVDADAFPQLRPLSWEQVRALHRAGITIGSHTRTHMLLTREVRSCVQAEAAGSRLALERELGVPIEHFAYPDGRFDETALAGVHAAGYRFAYTTCAHRHPRHVLLTIPRRMLWERSCIDVLGRFSGPVMGCQVVGAFNPFGHCAERHIERNLAAATRPAPQAG